MAKEKLQWISIYSEQAILMSVCLQSMVDELLLKKVGAKIKQVTYNKMIIILNEISCVLMFHITTSSSLSTSLIWYFDNDLMIGKSYLFS